MTFKLGKRSVTEKYKTSKTKRKASGDPQSSRATVLSPPNPLRRGTWQRVKFGWRQQDSLEGFAELAEWDPALVDSMKLIFATYETVEAFVKEYGSLYVGGVHDQYRKEKSLASQIDWPAVFALKEESQVDELAAFLSEIVKISPFPRKADFMDYHKLLVELYPSSVALDIESWKRIEETLLEGLQRPIENPDGDYIEELWEEIKSNFENFNPGLYLSPYTSIISPMGTGKTKALEEFARRKKCYVAYLNLASAGSFTIPKRSTIAETIAKIHDRDEVTTFFECYIASTLEQVLLCRQLGITPKDFWDLQVLDKFHTVQFEIAKQVEILFESANAALSKRGSSSVNPGTHIASLTTRRRIRSEDDDELPATKTITSEHSFMRRSHIDELLADHRKTMKSIFQDAFQRLTGKPVEWNTDITLANNELQCLFCLDEARELFAMRPNETLDASRYGAWRRALRHRATNEDKTASKLQFFGIVTDTTSRVSHLSPSKFWDQSLRSSKRGGNLFPPLWEISTFDTLAVEDLYRQERLPVHNQTLDNKYHRDLFSFGRPLWGTMLRNERITVDDVRKLVRQKMSDFNLPEGNKQPVPTEKDFVRSLALLSYRSMFFINLQSLAEHLSANYFHFIADISDDRTLVRTIQPSEPILSWIAAQEMYDPKQRYAVVQAMLYHTQRGFIDVGNVGEMTASMILLFAFDNAHGAGLPRPIPLSAFLKSLVPQVCDEIQSRCNDNSELNEVWNGSVYFNSFVETENDNRHITPEILQRAYARNAALFAPNNFEGCDIIIPVVVVVKKGRRNMTYILVQVKNTEDLDLTSSLRINAPQALKPHKKLTKPEVPPFFGLYMSLRGNSPPEKHPRAELVSRADENKAIIVVAGLDATVYPALQDEDGRMVSLMRNLLDCTMHINVPNRSPFLRRFYPIDNVASARTG